jgi:DNA repair exonuclease SbcCD nuclease subunit
MSKVALVSDLHFGAHSDDKKFQDSQFAFMEQMVNDCKERGIEKIFVLGDLFDTRHAVNVLTINRVVDFFKRHEGEVIWYIILGNHDLYYKNSMDVSSLVVLDRIKNVCIIDKPRRIRLDTARCEEEGKDHDTLLLPWVTDYEEFRNTVEKKHTITSGITRLFGHLDVLGAKMDIFNNRAGQGFDKDELFKHWKHIYTGHYHIHSETTQGDCKLTYLGSPYQLNRSEIEPKGFYILDTYTEELEFVKNEHCIEYKKLKYPEMPENPEEFIRGHIIDVEISWEDSKYMTKVNDYLEKLESYGPAYPVNPIYQRRRETTPTEKIDVSKITILSLGKRYIDDCEDIKNKSKVFQAFKELYSSHSIQ